MVDRPTSFPTNPSAKILAETIDLLSDYMTKSIFVEDEEAGKIMFIVMLSSIATLFVIRIVEVGA